MARFGAARTGRARGARRAEHGARADAESERASARIADCSVRGSERADHSRVESWNDRQCKAALKSADGGFVGRSYQGVGVQHAVGGPDQPTDISA